MWQSQLAWKSVVYFIVLLCLKCCSTNTSVKDIAHTLYICIMYQVYGADT